MKYQFLVALHFVFLCVGCLAQNRIESPHNCEINSAKLDLIRNQLLQQGEKKLVVIVSRLGHGETSSKLSIRRLFAIKSYLMAGGVPKSRIVTAEGEPVEGLGRIEIFLDGELSNWIKVGNCKDVPVGICDNDEEDIRKYQLPRNRIKCNQ